MFANAIKSVGGYTRPIHFVTKKYLDDTITATSATMFFVNDNGCAITCRHVAQQIIAINEAEKHYKDFRTALAAVGNPTQRNASVKQAENTYNVHPGTITHKLLRFPDSFDRFREVTMHLHAQYDLAIIEFKGFEHPRYEGHAMFAPGISYIQQGDMLCRLGFPFAEYTDWRYVKQDDRLEWDPSKPASMPRFPMDGMVSRFLSDDKRRVFGIELTTPGMMGQSGGPLFDVNGIVCGMQFETGHLPTGFSNGSPEAPGAEEYLHVGRCINVEVIKEFLDQFNIEYHSSDDYDREAEGLGF